MWTDWRCKRRMEGGLQSRLQLPPSWSWLESHCWWVFFPFSYDARACNSNAHEFGERETCQFEKNCWLGMEQRPTALPQTPGDDEWERDEVFDRLVLGHKRSDRVPMRAGGRAAPLALQALRRSRSAPIQPDGTRPRGRVNSQGLLWCLSMSNYYTSGTLCFYYWRSYRWILFAILESPCLQVRVCLFLYGVIVILIIHMPLIKHRTSQVVLGKINLVEFFFFVSPTLFLF